jgi:hypothetical protein
VSKELRHKRRTLAQEDKSLRYQLRDRAQLISPAKGVRGCGRMTVYREGGAAEAKVELRVTPDLAELRAHFAGVTSCKNPWQCAVCALPLQIERGKLIVELNDRHVAAGGFLYLFTGTIPHNEGDPLIPMRRKIADSWRRSITGAPWKRMRESMGIVGQVRAHEVTHGPNGFHPHVHAALYTDRTLTADELERLRAWMDSRWRAAIVKPDKHGRRWRAPSREHGVTLEPLRKTDYLAKMGLARELIMTHTKEGREGHRTPFQVLRDLLLSLDSLVIAECLTIWREWAKGMRGARQLTTSRGLMKRYDLPDISDRQLFLEEQGELGASEVVCWFTAEEWAEIVRRGPMVRVQLLRCVDRPKAEWHDYILKLLDRSAGIEPVPF